MNKSKLRLLTADPQTIPANSKHPFGLQYPDGRVVHRRGHVVRDPNRGPRLFEDQIEFFRLYCEIFGIFLENHPTRNGFRLNLPSKSVMEILWNSSSRSYTVDRRLEKFVSDFQQYIGMQVSRHGSLTLDNFLDTQNDISNP